MTCLANMRSVVLVWMMWFLNLTNFAQCHTEIPLLLLISFDGFRWDYLQIAKQQGFATPNFDRLINNGATIAAGGLKNTFVTKTLPNHFTLVTGLYEENHGIIANSFFDPVFNQTLSIHNPDAEDQKWWDGKSGTTVLGTQPIWVTNDLMGGKRASGSYFWPGSMVDNQRPLYTRCYNTDVDATMGVDTIIEWFTSKTRPINLGLLYNYEPDHTGHQKGAGSIKVLEKIVGLDGLLGRLLKALEEHDLIDRMNIILTSDHGMTNITNFVYVDDFVDPALYSIYGGSPVWNILPAHGKEEDVYKLLKTVPNVTVYKKEEIPAEFHYQKNRRIQPIILAANEGTNICSNRNSSGCILKGNHGYNNSLPAMHPIFIAYGPAFRKNVTVSPFNNVDVYPLMCHVLGIPPHPNDGNLDNVKQLLAQGDDDDDDEEYGSMLTFLLAVGLTAFVSGVCCIAACRSHRIYIRRNGQVLRRLTPNSLSMEEKGRDNKQPLLASEDEDFA